MNVHRIRNLAASALAWACAVLWLATTAVHASEGDAAGSDLFHLFAKIFNFALLAGGLAYFFKSPLAGHLSSRSAQIRHELVTASEMRAAAAAHLAEIARKLKSLPAELDALKAQGAEDVRNEKVRIAATAAQERERLMGQARREIDMRLRIARRELIEQTATLAVGIARERITRTITPEDQTRLVDRYTAQLGEAR